MQSVYPVLKYEDARAAIDTAAVKGSIFGECPI
jgi:hypothetical protein